MTDPNTSWTSDGIYVPSVEQVERALGLQNTVEIVIMHSLIWEFKGLLN
jgi:hypothetical protein